MFPICLFFIFQEQPSHSQSQDIIVDANSSEDEDSSSENEELAIEDNMSLKEKVQLLLLLATKKRHNLTYKACETFMEFAGVLADEENPFHPSRHIMKRAIEKYSYSVTVHHLCPGCGLYYGTVASETFQCRECGKEITVKENKKKGNYFYYLSIHDQIKLLLETCLSEGDFIKPLNREKIHQYNYEDIYDGSRYKANVGPEELSINFFVDGVQVRQ